MNMHVRSYSAELATHYAAVHARLHGRPMIAPEPVVLLFAPPAELHLVADPVPNQRGKVIMPISPEAELAAARRALMIFARLRDAKPAENSVRQMQVAVATAFKIDLTALSARSRRPGPVRIRQIAMILARRSCARTLNDTARRFQRNHSTVLYAERKFAAFLAGATSQIRSADGR